MRYQLMSQLVHCERVVITTEQYSIHPSARRSLGAVMNCEHKDFCFKFTLGSRKFEAVGFLKAGETSVTGDEAIRRTDNGHIVRSHEDWRFMYEHQRELPKELMRYWLATARPYPSSDSYRSVSRIRNGGTGWFFGWTPLYYQWYGVHLVLRFA